MDTVIMTRGDTRTLELTIVDVDTHAVDLTDVYLWFTAKRSLNDTDDQAILRKTSALGGGITVTDAAGGLAKIDLVPADTIDIPGTQGLTLFWDLQSKSSSDAIVTLDEGVMVIKAGVTRSYVP